MPVPDRLWALIIKTATCWVWIGPKIRGYGATRVEDKHWLVHRLMFQEFVSDLLPGMEIDHKCRVRACVNPDHLQQVTRGENAQNLSGPYRNSTSGVRGVRWDKATRKWRARAQARGVMYHGGLFETIEAAEKAAIDLRNRIHSNNLADRSL